MSTSNVQNSFVKYNVRMEKEKYAERETDGDFQRLSEQRDIEEIDYEILNIVSTVGQTTKLR